MIMKVNICGIEIDRYSFDEVAERIINHALAGDTPQYVVTPNAQHIILLQKDANFRDIYRKAWLVVPDGVSLLWAANFLQTPLTDRVNGTDILDRICAISPEKKLKLFFLGGRPGAAEKAKETLQIKYPGINIVGTYCPAYGFECSLEELARINSEIKATAPHILFVGLGAPKQEKWIHANYQQLEVPISIGIGVSFELISNMVKRAPLWMQKRGLEWFFRLIVEPRRLWQRYIIGNPKFIGLVLKQRLVGAPKFE